MPFRPVLVQSKLHDHVQRGAELTKELKELRLHRSVSVAHQDFSGRLNEAGISWRRLYVHKHDIQSNHKLSSVRRCSADFYWVLEGTLCPL